MCYMNNKKALCPIKGKDRYVLCKIHKSTFMLPSPDLLEDKNVKTCMKGINWVTIIMGDSLLVSTMFLFFPLLWCYIYVCVCVCMYACVLSHFSHVWLCVTPLTVSCQTPLSMGFSRQEYWSGLPCSPPGDVPGPGITHISYISSIGMSIV